MSVYNTFGEPERIDKRLEKVTRLVGDLAGRTGALEAEVKTATARYLTKNVKGESFGTEDELERAGKFYYAGAETSPTVNDYAIVLADETRKTAAGLEPTTRYVFQGGKWTYQYTVSETAFSQGQMDAVNSGVTSAKVSSYDAHVGDTGIHVTDDIKSGAAAGATAVQPEGMNSALSSKVDKVDGKGLSTNDFTDEEQEKLANIAVKDVTVSGNTLTITATDDSQSTFTDTTYSAVTANGAPGLMTGTDKKKLDGIAAGAQVNTIETVKVNNKPLPINNKAVNIDLSGKADASAMDYSENNAKLVATIQAVAPTPAVQLEIRNVGTADAPEYVAYIVGEPTATNS